MIREIRPFSFAQRVEKNLLPEIKIGSKVLD